MRFSALTLCLFTLLFASCQQEKTTEETSQSTSTETVKKDPTYEMKDYLIISHEISGYNQWKMGFDAGDSDRKKNGINVLHVLRNTEDTNQVEMVCEIERLQEAKEFIASPNLKHAMEMAGVEGDMRLEWMTGRAAEQITKNGEGQMVITRFHVASYEKWKTAFQKDEDKRTASNMELVNLLQDAEDHNNVMLVMRVSDFNKVDELTSSMEFKMAMLDAGVNSIPRVSKLNQMSI